MSMPENQQPSNEKMPQVCPYHVFRDMSRILEEHGLITELKDEPYYWYINHKNNYKKEEEAKRIKDLQTKIDALQSQIKKAQAELDSFKPFTN